MGFVQLIWQELKDLDYQSYVGYCNEVTNLTKLDFLAILNPILKLKGISFQQISVDLLG